jgi:hypothetical protein
MPVALAIIWCFTLKPISLCVESRPHFIFFLIIRMLAFVLKKMVKRLTGKPESLFKCQNMKGQKRGFWKVS